MSDLARIRRDLQESLSLDKHSVGIFIGAGCPVAVRVPRPGTEDTDPLIPDVHGLTAAVREELAGQESFSKLLEHFDEDGRHEPTIEDLLSHVRLARRVVGKGKFRGLDEQQLADLEKGLCGCVAAAVNKELPHTSTPYHHLAGWVAAIERSRPVTLFTTNYDLLLEQALEEHELPFFDGFVGSRSPFFDLRAIEDDAIPPRWTRLWKLHGSVNWRLRADGSVIRTAGDDDSDNLLIHPSELKYDQSRRMPYLAMLDRLREFLRKPSAFLVTIGYSFADDHLNEVLVQGLRSNPTAAGFALLYKNLEDEAGAVRVEKRAPANLSLVARDSCAGRGERTPWSSNVQVSSSSEGSGSGEADSESELGDFAVFATFLKGLGSLSDDRSDA